MILVQVTKNSNESPTSLIRRFTKKVQDAGILRHAKSLRYKERTLSHYKRKMATLERIQRKTEYEKLKRLGKIKDVVRHKR